MRQRRSGLQKSVMAILEGVPVPESSRKVRTDKDNPETSSPCDGHQEKDPRIEKIMASVQCPKDFECYKSGFERLCKAKLTADGRLVECLERGQAACTFRFTFLERSFCKCLLRQYIAKELGR